MDKEQIKQVIKSQLEAILYFKEKTKELESKLKDLHEQNVKLRTLLKDYSNGQAID